MSFLPFYFGIILAGIIFLSNNTLSGDEDEKSYPNESHKNCTYYAPIWHEFDIDQSFQQNVDPCIDFYQYSCNSWQRKNPMPTGYVTWSTLSQMQYKTYHRVHELLIKKNEYDKVPFIKIAKQYHRSCMDEEAIEDEGLKPIKLMLKATGGWPILMSNVQWNEKNYTWQNIYNIYNQLYGFSNFFSLTYGQDRQDKSRNILMISHTLKYPFEEKLLKDTYRHVYMDSIIKVVRAFLADEGIQIPIKKLRTDVEEIIAFETNLRKLIRSKEEMTKVRITIAELQDFYNSFTETQQHSAKINWLHIIQSSFKGVNVSINASEPVLVNGQFFSEMALLLDATPPRIIVNYMQWNIVSQLMKYLDKQMRHIESNYYYLNYNMIQQVPRWLTCVQNLWIKHFRSYLFVKTYISVDTLKAVSKMVDEIKAELKERVSLLPWMNEIIKNNTIDKINKVSPYIGYPKWYDNHIAFIEHYKGLKLGKSYFENQLAIAKHEKERIMIGFRTRVRDNKNTNNWPIYPIVVRAVYVRKNNIIVIPAALVQDPYFTLDTPPALNYGAIGFIIGHELAHSLGINKIERWKCLIELYNNITLDIANEDGKPILYGSTALKENIADFIGAQVAFAAFQKNKAQMERQPKLRTFLNVTDEQLFFLSLANIMCTLERGTYMKDVARKSLHSPNRFRVIGTLSNMESFSEIFKCSIGRPMNPELKCRIWE